jgi:hypothetical protein
VHLYVVIEDNNIDFARNDNRRMRSHQNVLLLLAIVASCVVGLSLETLPPKRLAKSTFINKQKHDKLPKTILSPEELALWQSSSANFCKPWLHRIELSVPSIQYNLSENLPHPVNPGRFASLAFSSGVAADIGKMSSFSDVGTPAGHALDLFCLARFLANFLMAVDIPLLPPFWNDVLVRIIPFWEVQEEPWQEHKCPLLSLP